MASLHHLYLMRHAIAEDENPDAPRDDSARRLTERGRERAAQVVKGLHRLGVHPEAIWSSPAVRTFQTAQIAAAGLGLSAEIRTVGALSCGSTTEAILAELANARLRSLLIVGHEPNLSLLVSSIIAGKGEARQRFKKSGVAHLEVHPLRGRVSGRLVAYLPPRALRLIGDPSLALEVAS